MGILPVLDALDRTALLNSKETHYSHLRNLRNLRFLFFSVSPWFFNTII